MTENELSAMTVMQLRKLAKEQKITLGAGIDKAGIIRKIFQNCFDLGRSHRKKCKTDDACGIEAENT